MSPGSTGRVRSTSASLPVSPPGLSAPGSEACRTCGAGILLRGARSGLRIGVAKRFRKYPVARLSELAEIHLMS